MITLKWSDVLLSIVTVISLFVRSAQSDVLRPRGVSLAKASLYPPTKDFTCLDGTVTIPFSYVNDDYCDCFDGSDEPGTSACLNGIFHCTNAGHQAQNIPSSRVNDGVCDCCDGTDEYATSEGCPNVCEELGKEAQAEALRRAELLKAGSVIRQELIDKSNQKRNEMAEQLKVLEQDKNEAEKIKQEKEKFKLELEAKENEALKVYREAEEQERQKKAQEEEEKNRKEAVEYFTSFDSDSDGQLTVGEIQTRNIFDKDKDGEVSEEEIKYFFGDNESVNLEIFMSHTWPLLKPLLMRDKGYFPPQTENDDGEEAEQNNDQADIEADDLGMEENEPEDGYDDEHQEEEQEEQQLDLEPDKKYDEETQKLVDEASEARRQFTEVEVSMREIEANIRKLKENLEKDYGPQQEYAVMDGQCFEYEDKEYIYKLCLFQKFTQKPKSGSSEIGLGNWGEWGANDGNPYSIMKYTNGVACWNGPSRMTTVHIQCGLENKLLSVTEPFRCEYSAEFSTPAACDFNRASQDRRHDEL